MRIIDVISAEKEMYCQTPLGKTSIEMGPIPTDNKEVDLVSAAETNV